MSWEQAKNLKQSGDFISLKDGESVKGVVRGEPYIFYQGYPDKTEYTTPGDGRSTRFKLPFVVKEDGYTAKILAGGYFLLSDIVMCKDKYGLDAVFEIKRKGTGTNTRYSVLFEEKLSAADKKLVNAVELPSLSNGRAREDVPPPEDEDFEDIPEAEDLPF